MPVEPTYSDPVIAARSAAAATIARVLEQVGVRPERIEYEAGVGGAMTARVVIEKDVSELLCSLNSEGDLISARLIEL